MRSCRSDATLSACRDAATAASTVAEAPVSTSSVMTRALDGPTKGTSRSVPAATRSRNRQRQRDDGLRRALVAELQRSFGCRAAMSWSSPAATMLTSAGGWSSSPAPRFRRRPPVLEWVAKYTLHRAMPRTSRKYRYFAYLCGSVSRHSLAQSHGGGQQLDLGEECCMGNRLLPLLLMVATVAGCNGGAERQKQVEATLHRTLAAQTRPPFVTTDAEGRKLWKLTRQFYERRRMRRRGSRERTAAADRRADRGAADRHRRGTRSGALQRRAARAAPPGSRQGLPDEEGLRAEGGRRARRLAHLPLSEVRVRPGRRPLRSLARRSEVADQTEKFDPAAQLEKALPTTRSARRSPS